MALFGKKDNTVKGWMVDDEQVATNRQLLDERFSELFEVGALREVYRGRVISIYAVAENSYGFIPFDRILGEDDFWFNFIDAFDIKRVLKEERYFESVLNMRRKEKKLGALTDETAEKLLQMHDSYLEQGKKKITPKRENNLFRDKLYYGLERPTEIFDELEDAFQAKLDAMDNPELSEEAPEQEEE
ncbi:MAG: hypothetical protein KBS66_04360 [Eubacterium sp.]|nr:hypothetical protein [Candidatus Colimonas fimequi]